MTALKQEAFALIESIPYENSNSRAERNLAIMDEIQKLVGDDVSWVSEEEMIQELAEMRRQRLRS